MCTNKIRTTNEGGPSYLQEYALSILFRCYSQRCDIDKFQLVRPDIVCTTTHQLKCVAHLAKIPDMVIEKRRERREGPRKIGLYQSHNLEQRTVTTNVATSAAQEIQLQTQQDIES